MLPLGYSSNCNYDNACSQPEHLYSRLVWLHTIFLILLCPCDLLLSLANPWFALESHPLQLMIFAILARATFVPISQLLFSK
jgi:hypothetical protein